MDLLSGFDEGVGRHDHEDAIGEDGQNDEEREERMNEDVDGHPPDGIERRQEPHGVRRTEPENVFAFADHHERLQQHKSPPNTQPAQPKRWTTTNDTHRMEVHARAQTRYKVIVGITQRKRKYLISFNGKN